MILKKLEHLLQILGTLYTWKIKGNYVLNVYLQFDKKDANIK